MNLKRYYIISRIIIYLGVLSNILLPIYTARTQSRSIVIPLITTLFTLYVNISFMIYLNKTLKIYNTNKLIILNVICTIISYIYTIILLSKNTSFFTMISYLVVFILQGVIFILLGLQLKKSAFYSTQPQSSLFVILPSIGICHFSFIFIGNISALIKIVLMTLLFLQIGKILGSEINNNATVEIEQA